MNKTEYQNSGIYFNHIIVNHNKKDDVKILNISQFTFKN